MKLFFKNQKKQTQKQKKQKKSFEILNIFNNTIKHDTLSSLTIKYIIQSNL